MSVFDDFEGDRSFSFCFDEDPVVTYDVNEILKRQINRILEVETEIVKAWFQMAFSAGKDYEDLPFEIWWDNFYKTLQQGAEDGN